MNMPENAPRVNDTATPHTMSRRTALTALAAAPFAAAPALASATDPAVSACQAWHDAELAYNAAADRLDESNVPGMPQVTLHETVVWVDQRSGEPRSETFSDRNALDHDNWMHLFGREQVEAGRAQLERLHAERDAAFDAAHELAGTDAAFATAQEAREAAITTRATTMAGVLAKAEAAVRGDAEGDGVGPENMDWSGVGRMMESIAEDLRGMKNTPLA